MLCPFLRRLVELDGEPQRRICVRRGRERVHHAPLVDVAAAVGLELARAPGARARAWASPGRRGAGRAGARDVYGPAAYVACHGVAYGGQVWGSDFGCGLRMVSARSLALAARGLLGLSAFAFAGRWLRADG